MIKDRAKRLAYIRRWKRENPAKRRAQQARWRARHPEYNRDWKRRNPERVAVYNQRRRHP